MTDDVHAARRDRFEGNRRITAATVVIGGVGMTVAAALVLQFANQQASATAHVAPIPQLPVGAAAPTTAPTTAPAPKTRTPTSTSGARSTSPATRVAPPVQAPAPVYQAPAPNYQPPPPPNATSGGS